MCGGKGGGQSTNTTVTKSDPPEYVAKAYQDLLARATEVSETPYTAYTGQTVADLTPDQLAAFQTIQNAQTITDPYYAAANTAIGQSTGNVMQGVQDYNAENLAQYYNPYQQAVIDATMANINETNAQQQTQLQGEAISKGAWGGDRSGIAAAELARQQGLAANQTLADLQSSGYTNAQSMLQSQNAQQIGANQANNAQYANAATAYGNLGTSAQTAALQGASTQLQSGALQQQQSQNELNAAYQQWLEEQSYPFETTQFLQSNVFGLPQSGTSTSTSTSPAASTVSQLGGIGLTGLSLYGAMSGGSKDGGRIGYKRGGVAMPKHYLYGGSTPYTRGIPNLATGYVPASQNVRSSGSNMMQPTGSTAKSVTPVQEKSLGQQAADATQTGVMAKNTIEGAKKLKGNISDLYEKYTLPSGVNTAGNISGMYNPSAAASNFLNEGNQAFSSGIANTAQQADAAQFMGDSLKDFSALPTQSGTPWLDSAVNSIDAGASGLETAANAGEAASSASSLMTGIESAGVGLGTNYALQGLGVDPSTASTLGTAASLAMLFLLKDGGRVPKPRKLAYGGLSSDEFEQDPYLSDEIKQESEAYGWDQETTQPQATTGIAAKERKVSPWEIGLSTGLAMMAGESPNAITNIAKAGQVGFQNYQDQKEAIEKANYRDLSAQQAADKLMQEAAWRKRQGDEMSRKNDLAEANAQFDRSLKMKELGIQQGRLANEMAQGDYDLYPWTLKDKDGNAISGMSSYNNKTGRWLNNQPPPEGALVEQSNRKKSEGQSVFDTKFALAMKITGGDEKASFDMASGIKQMSDEQIRKYASDYADKAMEKLVTNDPDEERKIRRKLIEEQIGFIKNGFASGAPSAVQSSDSDPLGIR